MLKTTKMKLVELMILREDIDRVLEYLGKHANFEIQNEIDYSASKNDNYAQSILDSLQSARAYLGIEDPLEFPPDCSKATEQDKDDASQIISAVEELRKKELESSDFLKRTISARDEARAFANLKVSYSELEHLTFLSFRIGKIDPAVIDELIFSLGDRAIIIPLGEDKTRILAASSKKGRFALDTELKRYGFVALDVPKDFKGVPEDVLEGLEKQVLEVQKQAELLIKERSLFAQNTRQRLIQLIFSFSIESKIIQVRDGLESTQMVYRITGWSAENENNELMKNLDNLTEGRIAIRIYQPNEVPSVQKGLQKVPVRYNHGVVVKSFERMIFSYGAPLYGTIDPTPIVAFFFTLLFGIMFGDVGQGAVFFGLGLALVYGKIKFLAKWKHFGPLFVSIGIASMCMGVLTGEFFANGDVLHPLSRWITGFFGEPRDHILELMPSADAIDKILYFFGFTIAIGFIINSIGLIINIINQFSLGHTGRAIFNKTGLCGAFFFWYVVFMAVRIFFFSVPFAVYDVVILSLLIFLIFLSEPLTRLVDGHRPFFPHGLFAAAIEGVVEILEIVSTSISNSVSFLRVGAFALSHAVLSFIVFTLMDLVGGQLSAGGMLVSLIGNAVIIVLEGLIVAIQGIRLQYYEFFSKFFTETGREFKPFRFVYKGAL